MIFFKKAKDEAKRRRELDEALKKSVQKLWTHLQDPKLQKELSEVVPEVLEKTRIETHKWLKLFRDFKKPPEDDEEDVPIGRTRNRRGK
jgi:hypothetical protein